MAAIDPARVAGFSFQAHRMSYTERDNRRMPIEHDKQQYPLYLTGSAISACWRLRLRPTYHHAIPAYGRGMYPNFTSSVGLERFRASLGATPSDELLTLLMLVRRSPMPLSLASWLEMALLAEMDAQMGRRATIAHPLRGIDPVDIPKSVVVLATLAAKLEQSGLARARELVEAAAECLKPRRALH